MTNGGEPTGGSDDAGREPWMAGPPPPPPRPGPPPAGGPGYTGDPGRRDPDATSPGTTTMARLRALHTWSVWDLAASAILAAFAISWVGSVLQSFRHDPGVDSQYRVLVFFGPGSVQWALAVVVATGLVAVGRHLSGPNQPRASHHETLVLGLGAAGGAVGISAAIDALVELTNFGHGIDDALVGLLSYVAVVPVAAAVCWWAHTLRDATHRR